MQETTLYRHFNSAGELLYVGISTNAYNRYKQHRQEKNWVNQVTSITLERFNRREFAIEAEKIAIEKENPKYNVIHKTVRYKNREKVKVLHDLPDTFEEWFTADKGNLEIETISRSVFKRLQKIKNMELTYK